MHRAALHDLRQPRLLGLVEWAEDRDLGTNPFDQALGFALTLRAVLRMDSVEGQR